MTGQITVAPVDVQATQTLAMLARLDAELAGGGYSPDQTFGYSAEMIAAAGVYLVGAAISDELVGIAGLELHEGVGELKRFYVTPEHRGRGVSDALIGHLLRYADEHRAQVVRLETGDKQLAARAFYRRHGFVEVARFAPYQDSETSVCMSRVVRDRETGQRDLT